MLVHSMNCPTLHRYLFSENYLIKTQLNSPSRLYKGEGECYYEHM